MRSDGLRIEGPTALHVARVSATDDPGEVGGVDVVMLVIREITPIQPEDASQPGYRDTLVVTLRSGGFQGPGAGTDLQCCVLPRQRRFRCRGDPHVQRAGSSSVGFESSSVQIPPVRPTRRAHRRSGLTSATLGS